MKQWSLKMKVLISFAVIIAVVGAVAFYNLKQVERIEGQIDSQNQQTAKQRLALELKQKAQQLSSMTIGLALSGDLSAREDYEKEKEAFLALVEQVGAEASDRDQRRWKTSLNTTSGEFANQFNKMADILQAGSYTPEERTAKLQQQYKLSQAHMQYIFELTDNFHRVFTEQTEAAVVQTKQLLSDTERIMTLAIFAVVFIAVVVSALFLRSFVGPLRQLQAAVKRIQEGDLRGRIGSARTDELGALSRSFDEMTEQMTSILSNTSGIAEAMKQLSAAFENDSRTTADAGEHIVSAIHEVSSGSDQQTVQAEQSMAKVKELTGHVMDIRSITHQIMIMSGDTVAFTQNGSDDVSKLKLSAKQTVEQLQQTVDALDSLAARSKEIGSITATIEEISRQTNLLAVNAAIEAGHAGEHGRGFAVISDQVRALSDETKQSSMTIGDLIVSLHKQMSVVQSHIVETIHRFQDQQEAIARTSSAFAQIQESAERLSGQMSDIHRKVESAIEQNQEVIEAFHVVLSVAEENSASVQEVYSAISHQDQSLRNIVKQAGSVRELADELSSWMKRFTV